MSAGPQVQEHACDICDEVFESSFFCDKCSKRDAQQRHDDDWAEFDQSDPEQFKPQYWEKAICGNCCSCHMR